MTTATPDTTPQADTATRGAPADNALLLHACCGPCSITPVLALRDAGLEPTLYFFNPNIHPLTEYLRRREGLGDVAARLGVPVLFADADDASAAYPAQWLAAVAALGPPKSQTGAQADAQMGSHVGAQIGAGGMADMAARCPLCYALRLNATARAARRLGFRRYSTTLLYSKYQRHEDILAAGQQACQGACLAGARPDVSFHYQDFRPGWSEGIRLSKEWGIYRQQYCGCLLSEHDRYRKDLERALSPS